jgi:hypothetical protein
MCLPSPGLCTSPAAMRVQRTKRNLKRGLSDPHEPAALSGIITPNYGGFKKRTGLNFGGYTESKFDEPN